MNNLDNLESYSDVENLSRFSKEGFEQYCRKKLETCKDDVDFIMDHVYRRGGVPLKVCEIGSGNSKLLYSLEEKGILEKGTGYEVSKSRWRFAERFKEWMGSRKVENLNENILDHKPEGEKYDLVVAVDIVSQIITNLTDTAEEEYFSWINGHLKTGGYAYFELQSFKKEIEWIEKERKPFTWWEEFPREDPFQYGMYKLTLDVDGNIVYEKLFFERATGKFEGFKDVIRPYQEEEINCLLEKYGMKADIFHCYKKEGDLDSKLYLVLAKKVKEL